MWTPDFSLKRFKLDAFRVNPQDDCSTTQPPPLAFKWIRLSRTAAWPSLSFKLKFFLWENLHQKKTIVRFFKGLSISNSLRVVLYVAHVFQCHWSILYPERTAFWRVDKEKSQLGRKMLMSKRHPHFTGVDFSQHWNEHMMITYLCNLPTWNGNTIWIVTEVFKQNFANFPWQL